MIGLLRKIFGDQICGIVMLLDAIVLVPVHPSSSFFPSALLSPSLLSSLVSLSPLSSHLFSLLSLLFTFSLGVATWHLKIVRSSNSTMMFGVAPNYFSPKTINVYTETGWYFYGNGLGGLYSGPPQNKRGDIWGDSVISGDILTIILDFDDQTLYFRKNGKNLGAAYSKLPVDYPMRLVVLLFSENDCVQLL
jgi:hypothetical protein